MTSKQVLNKFSFNYLPVRFTRYITTFFRPNKTLFIKFLQGVASFDPPDVLNRRFSHIWCENDEGVKISLFCWKAFRKTFLPSMSVSIPSLPLSFLFRIEGMYTRDNEKKISSPWILTKQELMGKNRCFSVSKPDIAFRFPYERIVFSVPCEILGFSLARHLFWPIKVSKRQTRTRNKTDKIGWENRRKTQPPPKNPLQFCKK